MVSEKLEKKIVAVSSGFLSKEGKYLFLKRAAKSSWGVGEWQLLEGKIEWGETPQEAMQRETMEEANCKIKDLELLDVATSRIQAKGVDFHIVRIVFKGKLQGNVKISEDHSDFKFLTLEETLKFKLTESTRELVRKLQKENKL